MGRTATALHINEPTCLVTFLWFGGREQTVLCAMTPHAMKPVRIGCMKARLTIAS
jgi:hypothetical protein